MVHRNAAKKARTEQTEAAPLNSAPNREQDATIEVKTEPTEVKTESSDLMEVDSSNIS